MTALKFGKPRPSLLTKRDTAKAALANERKVRAAVKAREQGNCRVCMEIGKAHRAGLTNIHWRRGTELHHIVPRSLGGKDTTANCIWICATHHQERHAGVIRITGNGDKDIQVERIWS